MTNGMACIFDGAFYANVSALRIVKIEKGHCAPFVIIAPLLN
jgi:hypothetical protein